jgi:hypothetical protein
VEKMILDDLFTQAAKDYAANHNYVITIAVAIATNESQGFQSPSNRAYEVSGHRLTYTAAKTVPIPPVGERTEPAFFSGTAGEFSLTITAPVTEPYQVDISITKDPTGWAPFAAQVDPSSNVVYGSPGPRFVTLSLCSYNKIVKFG